MSENLETTTPKPPVRKSRRGTIVAILLLVAIWSTAIGYRMEIRAQWWAWRLTQVEDPALRGYYTACLSSIGDNALSAVPRILRSPDESVRLAGIRILRHCPDGRSLQYLLVGLEDPSVEVRDAAALELALRRDDARALPALEAMIDGPAPPALAAMVALERIGGPAAEKLLLRRLQRATDPDLLAQAIDSLGMLGCKAAEPAVREHLNDSRPLSAPPASQRRAEQAIAAIGGKLASQGLDPAQLAAAARTDLTVAAVARRALASIAGPPATRPAPSETQQDF